MNNINLKPVEILYLISKENKDVYTKKNILYCLIYELINNKNIVFNNKRYHINFIGDSFLKDYEESLLKLMNGKEFIELDSFITNLKFDKTLVENRILEQKIIEGKMFFILKVPKSELIKTSKYFELQAMMKSMLDKNPDVLKLVCPIIENQKNVLLVYNRLVEEIRKANTIKQEKDKKDNNDDIGEILNFKEPIK